MNGDGAALAARGNQEVCAPDPSRMEFWIINLRTSPRRDVLSDDEQERLRRIRIPAQAQSFKHSHIALREILGSIVGQDPTDLRFAPSRCPLCGQPHGKPQVIGHEGAHFSLSRRESVAVVGVGDTLLGVDVEERRRASLLAPLTGALVNERDSIARQAGPLSNGDLLRLWNLKEAVVKALGTGLATPLPSIAIENADPAGWHWVSGPEEAVFVREIPIDDSHVGALAVLGDEGGRLPVLHRWPTSCRQRVARF